MPFATSLFLQFDTRGAVCMDLFFFCLLSVLCPPSQPKPSSLRRTRTSWDLPLNILLTSWRDSISRRCVLVLNGCYPVLVRWERTSRGGLFFSSQHLIFPPCPLLPREPQRSRPLAGRSCLVSSGYCHLCPP